jgi:5-methylcytosine-specific restriction endonuclease McrA
VHSINWKTSVPAVIMLKEYMKKKTSVRFSKQNVFLRDNFQCAYCGIEVTKKTATVDHVLPVSLGGKTNFENTVTSCGSCNSKKGNNYRIRPKFNPIRPTYFQLVEKRKKFPFELSHPSWASYLKLNQ